MVKEMPLDIGMRVDVLDDEGIWNTGMIVDVGKEADEDEDKVEVKYDGWGDEYNQWVDVASQRLAPLHTYTIVKKCWAKLTKWPWWPAFVVLRAPTSALAAHGLEEETKLYVEFYDSFIEDKRSRCWMQKKNVTAFRDSFEERASKNFGKSFAKFVEGTQRAKAGTSPLLFSGPGTLPIEYSSKMAEPLEEKKKECTEEQWFHLYRDFSNRYQDLYGYFMAPSKISSSPGLQSGKRAPGRPPKVVKQVQSEDDNEEKGKVPEAVGAAISGDGEDETPAPERRSSRRNKRAAAPVAVAQRTTRPRRVKVIEVLTDASSSMVSPSSLPSRALSSRSIVNDQDSSNDAACIEKTELAPVAASLPDMSETATTHVKEQSEAALTTDSNRSDGEYRRKLPPVKLLERVKNAKILESDKKFKSQDANFYRDWSSGSRFEVDNKPWSILEWIMQGFKSRLQKE